MARIDLRDCTVKIKDGLAGSAAINQMMTPPVAGDSTLTIDTVALNTDNTQQVPVGARFTVAGETAATTIHTVTGRTPSTSDPVAPTTQITFTPALGAGTYADNGVITFQSQELSIKVGEGDVKYTENSAYKYELDRGKLDTVRKDNEVPLDVTFDFVYEHITTGTGETIAPMDAIKRRGQAAEWVSSATDKCEPFAVDIVIEHTPPCGTSQIETTTFPDFRAEKKEVSFLDAKITITGKCNVTEPIVARS